MELSGKTQGFWAGMPTRLKARLMGWAIYWALAIWLTVLGSLIGIAMLVLAIFWFIAKAWVLDSFLELDSGGDGLLNYMLGYIWNVSVYVRSAFMVTILAAALGGLGWFATGDLRREAAELTLSERISDGARNVASATAEKTGNAVEATKETTKGWMDRAKGWFGKDETPAE